jgi:hypothetical protein
VVRLRLVNKEKRCLFSLLYDDLSAPLTYVILMSLILDAPSFSMPDNFLNIGASKNLKNLT